MRSRMAGTPENRSSIQTQLQHQWRNLRANARTTLADTGTILTPPHRRNLMSHFLPYQLRWINDPSRLKIIEKSRQIGITFCTAYTAVKRVSPQNARLDVWVSSREEKQSRMFLDDCKMWAESFE